MKFSSSALAFVGAIVAEGATFAEVFGPAPKVSSLKPWEQRKNPRAQPFLRSSSPIIRDDEYYEVRDPSQCVFPLEVVLVQDTTSSTTDNFINMRDTQLDLMIEALSLDHPNSRFGITSFRDKPIWTLGSPEADYCFVIESGISEDTTLLHDVYGRIIPIGGGDPAENQMGALLATAQSEFVGWGSNIASRLMVLITDAQPHFEGDGFQKAEYNMTPFSGVFDEINMDVQCLAEYYPHPDQLVESIIDRETYVAFIVYDGNFQHGLPSEAWKWFNAYLGQTEGFVGDLGEGSTAFWESLAQVVREIEEVECATRSTQQPTETPILSETTQVAATTIVETTEVAATTIVKTTEVAETTTVETTEVAETTTVETTEVAETTVIETTEDSETTVIETTEVSETTVIETTEMADTVVTETAAPQTQEGTQSESVTTSETVPIESTQPATSVTQTTDLSAPIHTGDITNTISPIETPYTLTGTVTTGNPGLTGESSEEEFTTESVN